MHVEVTEPSVTLTLDPVEAIDLVTLIESRSRNERLNRMGADLAATLEAHNLLTPVHVPLRDVPPYLYDRETRNG